MREVALDPAPALRGQASPQLGVLDQASQGGSQLPDVALRHHDAGVANHMGNLSRVRPHHRTARRHGLDQHVPELLGPIGSGVRRQDQCIQRGQQRSHALVPGVLYEPQPPVQVRRRQTVVQRAAQRSPPDDQQCPVKPVKAGQRIRQIEDPLLRNQPPGKPDHRARNTQFGSNTRARLARSVGEIDAHLRHAMDRAAKPRRPQPVAGRLIPGERQGRSAQRASF